MDRVAERIEDGRNLPIDSGIMTPDVAHRERDVFGESSGTVHAHTSSVSTEMTPACQTISTAAADYVSFATDNFAGVKVVHIGSDRDDFADELVPNRHGNRNSRARPFVPLVNVNVSTANSGMSDANQNVIYADDGFGYVLEPQAGRRLTFYKCLQQLCHLKRDDLILLHRNLSG